MPSYRVPKEPDYGEIATDTPEKLRPFSIDVPMDPKWLSKLKLGEAIEVTLKGDITGIHQNESERRSTSEITMGVATVEYYKNSQVEELIKENDDE